MTATDPTDLETLYATILVFGVLSAAIYLLVLKPLLPNRQQPTIPNAGADADAAPAAANATRRNPAFNGGTQAASSRPGAAAGYEEASAAAKGGTKCARVPPHVSSNSASIAVNGGSNLLVDGLVAFRHCKAAAAVVSTITTAPAGEVSDSIRKERARVLSRLLLEDDGVAGSPPTKGSTVVLAVPEKDVACDKLHKAVFLLATYYNLLLLVAVDPDFDRKRKGDILQQLRQSKNGVEETKVSSDVLPDHRVVLTSTVTGRVAFARQLQRIELVLDFDPEVKQLLGRFGHRVIVYGEGSPSTKGVSIVGQILDS